MPTIVSASQWLYPATVDMKSQWQALFVDYLAFYETTRDQSVIDETWRRILDLNEPMHSLLVFDEQVAIGMANFLYHRNFWQVADVCYLNDLYVHPDARGKHVGHSLIQACYEHAQSNGVTQIYWTTAHDNEAARALYDKIGTQTPFIKYKMP